MVCWKWRQFLSNVSLNEGKCEQILLNVGNHVTTSHFPLTESKLSETCFFLARLCDATGDNSLLKAHVNFFLKIFEEDVYILQLAFEFSEDGTKLRCQPM